MKKLIFLKALQVSLIFFCPAFCQAQNHLAKANKLYDDLAYNQAAIEYKKVLKAEPNNTKAIFQIAHCYRLINNTYEAEKWYSKVVQMKEAEPTQVLYYTEALMSNGNYPEAEKWIMKYKQMVVTDDRTDKMLESLHNLNSFLKDSSNYSIQKLSINSDNSDCCPVVYNNGIVFCSTRSRAEMIHQIHQWTGLPFYSLYYAKGSENNFSSPKIFVPSIMTKFNNGTICFNKSEDELYISRNSIDEGKIKRSDNGIIKLKIYHYKKVGSKWVNETSFPYNSDQYNCTHPCLSPDGNKLFFASDMPGGFGGLDLYVCNKTGNDWSKPVNLGSGVNTSGDEGFPYIDSLNGLFYASNGRGGLGGLDIFYSNIVNDSYKESVNLGYPINSSGDDFGWFQNDDGTAGYFSSNRENKNLNDDIYSFKRISVLLNLLVYDAKTKLTLSASTIKVIESGVEKKILTTSDSGIVKVYVTSGKDYKFITEKEDYISDSLRIDTKAYAASTSQDIKIALNRELSTFDFEGTVYNNNNNNNNNDKKGIPFATVRLTEESTGNEMTTTTSEDGSYKFNKLNKNSRYCLEAKNDLGVSVPVEFSPSDLENNKTINTDVVLNNINDIVKIENIYYDLDQYTIREDAVKVLDKIVVMMKSNPDMKIEIRSHTDCRQTAEYNMILSQKRARSVVNYLVKRGISPGRLVAKGYGESLLINHCECENSIIVPCTEAEHQLNRRTEFKILTLN